MRSALATKSLVEMGFKNVAHVNGGFDALKKWFEIVKKKKNNYLKIQLKQIQVYLDPKKLYY